MKRIFLLSIAVFLVCAVNAQTEFSVPTLSEQQRYNTTRALLYNNILALINIAKSDGVSPEELGERIGEKFPWSEDATFEQFVIFIIRSMACMSDNVKIIEQSNEKVVITTPHIYPGLENQVTGLIYGSSLEDLIAYFDGMMRVIAKPAGIISSWTWGEEGLKIVITQ